MIRLWIRSGAGLMPVEATAAAPDAIADECSRALWIELIEPTREEELAVEQGLGLAIPTRAEQQEIEASNRLYAEDGALYMTATLPSRIDTEDIGSVAATFILAGDKLITVRYAEAEPFIRVAAMTRRRLPSPPTGAGVLAGLVEQAIEELADVLERIGAALDSQSRLIFRSTRQTRANGTPHGASPDLQFVITEIGRSNDTLFTVRDCLLTLGRLVAFARSSTEIEPKGEMRQRLRGFGRDIQGLTEYTGFLSAKIEFLLDATLGLINLEQNRILKIFSVATIMLMPPTLIAGIYGMNFKDMPELEWHMGYPTALVLMLCSAVLPYLYFKIRRWL